VVRPPGTAAPTATIAPRELMVIDVHAQAISLPSIDFFGIGAGTSEANRTTYGERETIVGGSIVYPLGDRALLRALRLALIGGVDGRFIDIRGGSASGVPSITARYDDVTAPGLAAPPTFVELREAVRLAPSLGNGAVGLNYLFTAQQFRASETSNASFNRWTADLRHEIPLYRRVASARSSDAVGPDQCAQAVNGRCPMPAWSRNREGSISFRGVATTSTTSGLNRVPFYLQPTVGGSDINGQPMLAAYDDYRFRAPAFAVLQETFEHSIAGPIGGYVMLEQGAVGDHGIPLQPLLQSYTVGVTLRAGGFPLVNLSFAWNRDSHHTIAAISPTLIGGSSRPSIF